ncbi:hypothetical protein BG53_14580 [Paenibacillus darwinianus]|uniref:Uncharacterized protein n=1 Tax=Paenibacillus darwinianus TaxID=1380763 RepID=A0A9W5S2T5_9BACL|nr:hypothetical protein [Paenibacillus darwinianus]EXX91848.1 hypothetical protein BG52_06735 [Paenibacillus darwinianus]EXX92364.1 hypothetical protein BG53_14580 [Paenibacillus darwinianus]EXX92736.1 hypothetical protein CH50_02045 [Paenibacillus darwinianus]
MPALSRKAVFWICFLLLGFRLLKPVPLAAEAASPIEGEALRELLEKSLSVTEIDKEIGRIAIQKAKAADDIAGLAAAIVRSEAELERYREKAGAVLRAYYTGERNMLLAAAMSFDNLPQLFVILDYVEVILSNDKHTLDRYRKQYRDLQAERTAVEDEERRLAVIERSLLAQRERLVQLQSEIDGAIAASGDEERLRALIRELVAYWELTGLEEVRRYYQALGKAMRELPKWLNSNKELLEIDGFTYTLRLPQEELNRFLREQNAMFEDFEFRFEEGSIIAQGRRDGMQVDVSGHYTLEDKPQHAIRFRTDLLKFNGLALPDTTRAELEREFDLNFYPQKLVSFLKATSVEMGDGVMTVRLKVNLK